MVVKGNDVREIVKNMAREKDEDEVFEPFMFKQTFEDMKGLLCLVNQN